MNIVQRIRYQWVTRFGSIPTPDKWVLIVDSRNEGTTLPADLLGVHPDSGALHDEGQFLTDQLPTPKALGSRRLRVDLPEVQLTEHRTLPACAGCRDILPTRTPPMRIS